MIRRARTNPRTGRNPRAFTIVEIMVTLGVLILLAAGVATIFNSISDTVNEGRRLAELNRFASRIELVMRRDFERMSRDGFLVIVHQNAPGANPGANDRNVQLNAADATDPDGDNEFGRPRRADEILFFARGEYETARRAVSPNLVARSTEAAIYYGHGQQRLLGDRPPNDERNQFFNPSIDDPNFDNNADFEGLVHKGALGYTPTDGTFNPNRYASDWTLLRHVTLLAQPKSAGQDLPEAIYGVTRLNERDWLEDTDRQIALQPATRSIFGTSSNFGLTQGFTNDPIPNWFLEYPGQGGLISLNPLETYRTSGLVDIATDDLGSIRTIMMGAPLTDAGRLFVTPSQFFNTVAYTSHDQFELLSEADPVLSTTELVDAAIEPNEYATTTPQPSAIYTQRQWMLDALPSLWELDYTPDAQQPRQIARVRYQQVPPRLFFDDDTYQQLFGSPTDPAAQRESAYAQADQEMLGSAIFVPNCTEFIVEWSYGFIDRTITDPQDPRYKQPIWYGLTRYAADTNADGLIDINDEPVAAPYLPRPTIGLTTEQIDQEEYLSLLVHGHVNTAPGTEIDENRELSLFGYEYDNPDFSPQDNPVAWPWPKFIRITMSLADPTDPGVEETFVFTFEIPDAPASKN